MATHPRKTAKQAPEPAPSDSRGSRAPSCTSLGRLVYGRAVLPSWNYLGRWILKFLLLDRFDLFIAMTKEMDDFQLYTTNHHLVLGVWPGADTSQIRRQCRLLKARWHPDRNPHALRLATERFKRIQQSCELSKDHAQWQRVVRWYWYDTAVSLTLFIFALISIYWSNKPEQLVSHAIEQPVTILNLQLLEDDCESDSDFVPSSGQDDENDCPTSDDDDYSSQEQDGDTSSSDGTDAGSADTAEHHEDDEDSADSSESAHDQGFSPADV